LSKNIKKLAEERGAEIDKKSQKLCLLALGLLFSLPHSFCQLLGRTSLLAILNYRRSSGKINVDNQNRLPATPALRQALTIIS